MGTRLLPLEDQPAIGGVDFFDGDVGLEMIMGAEYVLEEMKGQ